MSNYSKFHSKALSLYGNRFIYHWDTYTRLRDKMTITDTVTGITFEQIPSNHLKSLPHSVKSKKDYSNLCLSQEEALNKLKEWHPNLDFSKTIFKGASKSITVVCPTHGKFTKRYSDFKETSGCPSCGKERMKFKNTLSQEEFLERVSKLHPNLDLSKVIYVNSNTPVTVSDAVRGEFKILPVSLLKGYGSNIKQLTQKEFISKVSELHPEYNFSNTLYKGMKELVEFICPVHDKVSMQAANLYYRGSKCKKCSYDGRSSLSQEDFLKVMDTKKNSQNLDLSKAIYTNTDTPLIVICPVHGEFKKTPKLLIQNFICNKCSPSNYSKYELEIIEYIKSLNILEEDIIHSARPSFMNGQELDIYLPKYNLAIEFNGSAFHHSSSSEYVIDFFKSKAKSKTYHYNKWKLCFDEGITLLSIYDFYWVQEQKQEIYKSKINHYLNLDKKIFGRKCTIVKDIDKKIALNFLDSNHIEGSGFQYKNSTYYGLHDKDTLIMVAVIGQFYNQSNKSFKYKLNRICTLKGHTVIGGISKLTKQIKKDFGNFTYQITLSSGGTSLKAATDYRIIDPRYFWVNPNTLKYYHRNYCQKQKLIKHFQQPMLDEDTENTYMERLGFLKIYDNGLAEIQI